MNYKNLSKIALILGMFFGQEVFAQNSMKGAVAVDKALYANREVLPDALGNPQPPIEKSLTHIKGNLYRHTNDKLPSLHSGLVLINKEGAFVIDPANTQSAKWLQDEIQRRFGVPVKYVIMTHAHYDHIGGTQVFSRKRSESNYSRKWIRTDYRRKTPCRYS